MSTQDGIPPLNRFPRMMQEYMTRRVRAAHAADADRIMALKTREEALEYIAEVRKKLSGVFGPWPDRTELNVRVTGEQDRGTYRVRNVIFDSRPGFPVTANIYLPVDYEGPRPAVLCLCGHSSDAKIAKGYQAYPQTLARKGYVTLVFDPMGQGERYQYPDEEGGSHFGKNYPSVFEHNAADREISLTGDWIGNWFIWDGIRALDVLLDQPDVDLTRVGVTGVSGGGTTTAYAVACDPRITMSAPCCWVSSWCHDMMNEEPIDAEQCPPGILGAGLEQIDLLISRAPAPTMLVTEEQDFFDQRGSLEAFELLKHVYRLLDAEENIAYYVGPGIHGYHKEAREAMYGFFNRHAGVAADSEEPELNVEEELTLRCTPTGQVNEIPDVRSVPDLTGERSRLLAAQRGSPSGAELLGYVTDLLNLPERDGPPEYRILRPWSSRGYARSNANQFVLETEPEFGAQAVVTKLEDERRAARPLPGDREAVLYIPHHSSDAELREDEFLRQLETETPAFFACDYRGIGESRPDTCRPDSFLGMYGSDYHYASYAKMLGESVVAWRVHDILCTLDWMASFGYDKVHLVAKMWGTIPGSLAALLDERIQRVTLIHPPNSYSEMAETPMQSWPLSAMFPGVLQRFDLPDVYRELEKKGLRLIDPSNAMMECSGVSSR